MWLVAQAFLNTLYTLFGGPERIAFQHTLTEKPYRLLLSWIRCGEAMMRRLLLIEAAAYPKPNTRPRLWPKRTRIRRLVGFDDDKPEMWRVSFRCFSSPVNRGSGSRRARDERGKAAPSSTSEAHRPLSPAAHDSSPAGGGAIGGMTFWQGEWFTAKRAKFYSAWPLAERYEALLRVFNNPAPYARRLAKRLHALTHRLGEILRSTPEAAYRVERFEALTHAAEARWRPAPNTS